MNDWAIGVVLFCVLLLIRSMYFWVGWNLAICDMWDSLPPMSLLHALVLALTVPRFGGGSSVITNSK